MLFRIFPLFFAVCLGVPSKYAFNNRHGGKVVPWEPHVLVSNRDYPCVRGGFYRHPENCARFYRCVNYALRRNTYSRYLFECPEGEIFSDASQSCIVGTCDNPSIAESTDSLQLENSKITEDTSTKLEPKPIVDSTPKDIIKPTKVVSNKNSKTGEDSVTVDKKFSNLGSTHAEGTTEVKKPKISIQSSNAKDSEKLKVSSDKSPVSVKKPAVSTPVKAEENDCKKSRFLQQNRYCNLFVKCENPGFVYACNDGAIFNQAKQTCEIDSSDVLCKGKSLVNDETNIFYETYPWEKIGILPFYEGEDLNAHGFFMYDADKDQTQALVELRISGKYPQEYLDEVKFFHEIDNTGLIKDPYAVIIPLHGFEKTGLKSENAKQSDLNVEKLAQKIDKSQVREPQKQRLSQLLLDAAFSNAHGQEFEPMGFNPFTPSYYNPTIQPLQVGVRHQLGNVFYPGQLSQVHHPFYNPYPINHMAFRSPYYGHPSAQLPFNSMHQPFLGIVSPSYSAHPLSQIFPTGADSKILTSLKSHNTLKQNFPYSKYFQNEADLFFPIESSRLRSDIESKPSSKRTKHTPKRKIQDKNSSLQTKSNIQKTEISNFPTELQEEIALMKFILEVDDFNFEGRNIDDKELSYIEAFGVTEEELTVLTEVGLIKAAERSDRATPISIAYVADVNAKKMIPAILAYLRKRRI